MDRVVNGTSGRDYLAKWQKLQPSAGEQELRARFGCKKMSICLTQLLPLGERKLLAFGYFSPRWSGKYITVCLASDDAGLTWSYRSTPAPFDDRFGTHGYLRHTLDGLCEPSCTRLATGELLLVMRLGSFYSLYTAVSADEGRTWRPQADQRLGCYYETWSARPIAVHGILPTVLTLPSG